MAYGGSTRRVWAGLSPASSVARHSSWHSVMGSLRWFTSASASVHGGYKHACLPIQRHRVAGTVAAGLYLPRMSNQSTPNPAQPPARRGGGISQPEARQPANYLHGCATFTPAPAVLCN